MVHTGMLLIFNLSGRYVQLKTGCPFPGQKSRILSQLSSILCLIDLICFYRPWVIANDLSLQPAMWKTTEYQSKASTLWFHTVQTKHECRSNCEGHPCISMVKTHTWMRLKRIKLLTDLPFPVNYQLIYGSQHNHMGHSNSQPSKTKHRVKSSMFLIKSYNCMSDL